MLLYSALAQVCLEVVGAVSAALLTPVVAGLGLYIAWRQYKIAAQRTRFELFDRRLRIYEGVVDYLHSVVNDPPMESMDQFHLLWKTTAEVDFLFGDEINLYVKEIRKKSLRLRSLNQRTARQSLSDNAERQQAASEDKEILDWISAQIERECVERFRKYLDFRSR